MQPEVGHGPEFKSLRKSGAGTEVSSPSNLLSQGFVSPSVFISIHSNNNSLNMVLCLPYHVKGPRVVSECMMSLECGRCGEYLVSLALPHRDSAPRRPPLGSQLAHLAPTPLTPIAERPPNFCWCPRRAKKAERVGYLSITAFSCAGSSNC